MKTYTKPSDEELKKKLTPQQYEVTQQEGTEAPFRNDYWNEHGDGIFVPVDECPRAFGLPTKAGRHPLVRFRDKRPVYPQTGHISAKELNTKVCHRNSTRVAWFSLSPQATGKNHRPSRNITLPAP